MTSLQRSSFQVAVILFLLIFSFSINFFLNQGIPFFMYGNDVFAHTWESQSSSWGDLFRALFSERISTDSDNPDLFYMGIGQRTTSFIIAKGIMAIDGMRAPHFRTIVVLIVFSLNTLLLFLILNNLHVNILLSFLGAMLYATAVPTYSIISHLIDFSLFYHFFTLLCFYLFIAKYLKQEKTNPIFLSVLIFISAVLAIKSKQIAVIIPLVLFIYCLCAKQDINGFIKRRIPFFSLLLLYYLPNFFNSEIHRSFSDLLLNFRTYYLYNPWTKIGDGEQIPALFSPLKSHTTAAGSLMGIYNFFLGWAFIILLISFLISLYTAYTKEKKIEHQNCLLFIILWHFLEVSIMSTYFAPFLFEAIRYIGIATPSFIVFSFYSMQQGLNFILTKRSMQKFKNFVYCTLSIFIVISIISNFYVSVVQIRGGLLSRHTLIHDSIFVIYKDYFKQQNIDDTIFFKVFDEFNYIEPRDKERVLGHLFYTELLGGFGQPYDQNNLNEIKQKINENGVAYIATFKDNIPFTNKILLKKISACPSEYSSYCKLKDKIKGQTVFFYVFKVLQE